MPKFPSKKNAKPAQMPVMGGARGKPAAKTGVGGSVRPKVVQNFLKKYSKGMKG